MYVKWIRLDAKRVRHSQGEYFMVGALNQGVYCFHDILNNGANKTWPITQIIFLSFLRIVESFLWQRLHWAFDLFHSEHLTKRPKHLLDKTMTLSFRMYSSHIRVFTEQLLIPVFWLFSNGIPVPLYDCIDRAIVINTEDGSLSLSLILVSILPADVYVGWSALYN